MVISDNIGDLPRILSGPNRGRVDRRKVSSIYGFTVKQLTKAYLNWMDVFRSPYQDSTLTYRQYLDKLRESNLTPNDIRNVEGGYNLARVNDEGCYHDHNCRFILRSENLLEQKHFPHTEETKQKMKKNHWIKRDPVECKKHLKRASKLSHQRV